MDMPDTQEDGIARTEDGATRVALSIVIPAYNEERRLPATLRRLREYLALQRYGWEVLVIVNGSTDRTIDVARAEAVGDDRIQVIELSGRGKGLAARYGALTAAGDVVFLCDADLSMPPERLASFLEAVERADVVVGSREASGARRFAEPWHRHVMGRVFNYLVRALAVRGISDTQCGFKALRRDAAQDLFGQVTLLGWGFDVELLFLARRYGYLLEELGIDWYFDSDTRVRPGIDTLHMLWELLTIRWNAARGVYRPAGLSSSMPGDAQHV
jgi:dolichyl-phosphate beta-glucosyltransferase